MSPDSVAGDQAWQWFEASEYGGVDGGAMSKLFRNNAGTLSDAALLAREAIQNSWDAARRMRAEDKDDVPFSVVFRFVELWGADKARMIKELGLRDLSTLRSQVEQDPLVGSSVLDELEVEDAPLKLLYVEDRGTHGLFGSPKSQQLSHLFLAMYYLGGSNKDPGAGGSYGFGKSALQRVSRIHSVIAHSAFRAHPEIGDPETTRLVGFTWWPSFTHGDKSLEGRGIFARTEDPSGFSPAPFAGDEATELAARLGFSPRDAGSPEQRGSSFLIVDVDVDPIALIGELERWWWPAMEENLFDIVVETADGQRHVPRHRDNPFVRQFLPAHRIASGQDKPQDSNRERRPSDNWRVRGEVQDDLGDLGLVVADEPRDLYGDPSSGEGLVALMREPRMVISYDVHAIRRVPIRGVFIASKEANELLRKTEPASHDLWSRQSNTDIPAKATATAKKLLRSISNDVKKMAEEVAPPPPKEKQALRLFSQLLGGLLGSARGASPVPTGGEPFELRLVSGPSREVVGDGLLRLKARFSTKLAGGAPADSCTVEVSCGLHVEEDDRAGATLPLAIALVEGTGFTFDAEANGWLGELQKNSSSVFDVVSEPYSDTWTVQLQPTVTRVSDWTAL